MPNLYLALMLPDNNLLFYPKWSPKADPVTLILPAGSDFNDVEFLAVQVTELFPKGHYQIYCGLCEKSTTNLLDKISIAGFVIR